MHTDEEGEKSLITSSSSVSQPSPPLSSSSSSSPGKSASAAKKLVIQEPDKNQPDPRQQQREERRGSLSSSTLSVNRHAFQAGRHAYHRRVSFDNSTNEAPSVHHSFVLRRSTQGFERTKRTRTFMIPVDLDGGSTDAVCKTMTDFVDDDDMVVVVGAYNGKHRDPGWPKEKADELMNKLYESHQMEKISFTVDLQSGDPNDILDKMIDMYEPDMVVVTNVETSKYKNQLSGTGVFKVALKRCNVPICFVHTRPRPRSHSTGEIRQLPKRKYSLDQAIRATLLRSQSDPQTPLLRRLSSSMSTQRNRFVARFVECFKPSSVE